MDPLPTKSPDSIHVNIMKSRKHTIDLSHPYTIVVSDKTLGSYTRRTENKEGQSEERSILPCPQKEKTSDNADSGSYHGPLVIRVFLYSTIEY